MAATQDYASNLNKEASVKATTRVENQLQALAAAENPMTAPVHLERDAARIYCLDARRG